MPESLYDLLGVPEDATDAQLKRAYRVVAKTCHPDVNPDAEPGRFGRVAEAYEVLSDPSKRRLYDAARAAERRAARRGDAGASGAGNASAGHWTEFRERSRGGFGHGGGFAGGFDETYGNFHESEMRRRERLARDAERRREEERIWWAHEKEEATRASTRFRVNAARAEEKRAVRGRETSARVDVSPFVRGGSAPPPFRFRSGRRSSRASTHRNPRKPDLIIVPPTLAGSRDDDAASFLADETRGDLDRRGGGRRLRWVRGGGGRGMGGGARDAEGGGRARDGHGAGVAEGVRRCGNGRGETERAGMSPAGTIAGPPGAHRWGV